MGAVKGGSSQVPEPPLDPQFCKGFIFTKLSVKIKALPNHSAVY